MAATRATGTILALLLVQATPAERTKVRVYVNLAEYYGTVYVRPPSAGADHVLLRGQLLAAHLRIVNHGKEQQVHLRPSQSAPFNVHVAAMSSGESLAQGVVAQPALLRGAGREEPRALPATLKQGDSLQWEATVPNFQQLPAGHYRLKADAQVEGSIGGSPEVNNDHLVIELRDIAGRAERVELLRITATKAVRNRDFAEADAAARASGCVPAIRLRLHADQRGSRGAQRCHLRSDGVHEGSGAPPRPRRHPLRSSGH